MGTFQTRKTVLPKQVFVIQRRKGEYEHFLSFINHLNRRKSPSAPLMFKIRALLLFTFGFLVCSVKSDSASGCCVSWYGDAKPCTDCAGTYYDTNNFNCRNSIQLFGHLLVQAPPTEPTSETDCISYTVSESDCSGTGLSYISASSNGGMECPANTSDTNGMHADGMTSSAIAPNGILGLISASVVAFALV